MCNSKKLNIKVFISLFVMFVLILGLALTGSACSTTNSSNTDLPESKSGNKVNVQFEGSHVTCDVPQQVDKGKNLELHLDIAYDKDPNVDFAVLPDPQASNSQYPEGKFTTPITEYELLIDNIHVFVGDKEYRDAFTWSFQRNDANTLTINKDYVVNDLKIKCDATPRTAGMTLYGIEIEDHILEQYKAGTLKFNFKTPYQNHGRQHIRTLSNGEAFPVYEDDTIDVTITTTGNDPLPNLWFRTNSRFCEMGVDFTRDVSQDGKSMTFHIPHYVVRDHGSFRVKE